LKLKLKAIGTKYTKNGVEHLKISKIDIELRLGKLLVNLESPYEGDQALNAVLNAFINENTNLITSRAKPLIERSIENKVYHMMNSIFDRIDFATLFPQ